MKYQSVIYDLDYTLDAGELGEFEVEVHFTYSPGTPGRMYMPNGDPGYPDEPAEFEVVGVTYQSFDITNWFDICETLNSSAHFCEYVDEWAREKDASDAADYADSLREEKKYADSFGY